MLICSPLHQGHHIISSAHHHHHYIITVIIIIIIIIIISWHTHHLCPLCSISTFMFAFFLLLYRCCLLLVFSPSFWAPQWLTSLFFVFSRQSCSSMENAYSTTALILLSLLMYSAEHCGRVDGGPSLYLGGPEFRSWCRDWLFCLKLCIDHMSPFRRLWHNMLHLATVASFVIC